MTKLSVIIPTYNNSKNELLQSVGSVLQYHCDDIEVLIIDDGSEIPVNKALWLDDNRVRVFRQSNCGVSVARNTGLRRAVGEYILFMDADDRLVRGWGSLLKEINGEDIIFFNYLTNGGEIRNINSTELLIGKRYKNYCLGMIANPTKYLTVWGKFIKKSVIDKHQLLFNKELSFAEDGDFMIRLILSAKSAKLVPKILYQYQANQRSVVNKPNKNKVEQYLSSLVVSQRYIEHQSESIQRVFAFYIAMHVNVMMVHQVFLFNSYSYFFKQVRWMKAIIKSEIIRNALSLIRYHECFSPRLITILMLKAHLYMMAGIIYKLRVVYNNKNLLK